MKYLETQSSCGIQEKHCAINVIDGKEWCLFKIYLNRIGKFEY